MAPNRGKNRAREFKDLVQLGPKDFDPEADEAQDLGSEDDSVSEDNGEEQNAREHYVDVSKSKLRKPKTVALGPQYRGSKISRDAMDEDDENDPFSRGFDSEESGSDDEEMRGGSEEEEGDDSDRELDGSSDTDLSEEDEDVAYQSKLGQSNGGTATSIPASLKEAVQSSVTASISQARRDDAEKGRAVKRQRTTFDSLLNTRIKLQKGLIATNTLVGIPSERVEAEKDEARQALESAEAAAFNLWHSLNSFREELAAARTGTKRKRDTFSVETPTETLWAHEQAQDKDSRPHFDTVLKKWFHKTNKNTATVTERRQVGKSEQQATILDVLQEQLSNSDRLVKRAHVPRSCAPLQSSQHIVEDAKIYDDADFYGLLLKELLEQKSQDSVAASNIDIGFQMRRENKARKNVDTKASKGRKLRYAVHEKLQNFMAPEDRSGWGERQANDLFGSLFGVRLALAERDEEEEDEEMRDGVDVEEAGLMMFRS